MKIDQSTRREIARSRTGKTKRRLLRVFGSTDKNGIEIKSSPNQWRPVPGRGVRKLRRTPFLSCSTEENDPVPFHEGRSHRPHSARTVAENTLRTSALAATFTIQAFGCTEADAALLKPLFFWVCSSEHLL